MLPALPPTKCHAKAGHHLPRDAGSGSVRFVAQPADRNTARFVKCEVIIAISNKIGAGKIKNPQEGTDVRTIIQCIGTISRTVGYRLGRDLDRVIPLFLEFCGDPEDEEQQSESANELRENCLQGFESFVLRCPREVAIHLGQIVKVTGTLRREAQVSLLCLFMMAQVCQGFLQFDPYYTYGTEDDEDDDEDEEFSDEDAGDYSDDDDTSWKVIITARCHQEIRFINLAALS